MFEEWVSTEMMVLKVIDDDKAAANTFFKETALPLARKLETWIPTEIDNAPAFDYETARDWHVKEIMRIKLKIRSLFIQ